MTRLRFLMIVGVLVAGSLVLACSSSKKSTTTQPTATQTSATKVSGTTPSATGVTPSADTNTELSDLAAQFAGQPLTASYNYSTSGGGTTAEGSLTVYTSPPDSWRLDIVSGGTTSILIKNADGSFICAESSSSCFASPIGSTIPLPFFGFLNDPGTFAASVAGSFAGADVDRSDVTVAGQSGHCYSVSSSITGAEGTVEYCFSDDGLLLRAKTSAGGVEFTVEATSIEPSVDPADLALPYPVTSLGG